MASSDPPKKVTIEEAFAVIMQLSATVSVLVSKIDGLVDTVKTLTEVISDSNRLPEDTSSLPSSPPHVFAHSAYGAAACALRNASMIEDKATRAVIIGLKEVTNTQDNLKIDQETVNKMCEWSDDGLVKKAFEDSSVSFHRHPPNAPPNHRPLKIQFPSKEIRDRFLVGIRRKGGRPLPLKDVRRDLTPTELRIERERKIEIKQLNVNANSMKYGLRDTDIITYRNPRPLPPNYNSPSLAPPPSNRSADISFSDGKATNVGSSIDPSAAAASVPDGAERQ